MDYIADVIAIGALGYAIYQGQKSAAAITEEKRERQAEMRAVRKAHLTGTPAGTHGDGQGITYVFDIDNSGQCAARNGKAWIGRGPLGPITTAVEFPTLHPTQTQRVEIVQRAGPPENQPGQLVVCWDDDDGHHEDSLRDVSVRP